MISVASLRSSQGTEVTEKCAVGKSVVGAKLEGIAVLVSRKRSVPAIVLANEFRSVVKRERLVTLGSFIRNSAVVLFSKNEARCLDIGYRFFNSEIVEVYRHKRISARRYLNGK